MINSWCDSSVRRLCAMVPEEMTRIPNNKVFWFLCQLLDDVRKNLPEEFVFYAAGKTDLCHSHWDQNVEMWKQPVEYLGKDLASQETSDHHKTLVFWLDELMAEHHLHTCWAHVLDGFCLLDQLTDDLQTYMFNAQIHEFEEWFRCTRSFSDILDLLKFFFNFFTMVNQHQITIWDNIVYSFQASYANSKYLLVVLFTAPKCFRLCCIYAP